MKRIPVIMIASLFVIGIPAIHHCETVYPLPSVFPNIHSLVALEIGDRPPRYLYVLRKAHTYYHFSWESDRTVLWHMEEIKGNPKSQEAYKTSKQV